MYYQSTIANFCALGLNGSTIIIGFHVIEGKAKIMSLLPFHRKVLPFSEKEAKARQTKPCRRKKLENKNIRKRNPACVTRVLVSSTRLKRRRATLFKYSCKKSVVAFQIGNN